MGNVNCFPLPVWLFGVVSLQPLITRAGLVTFPPFLRNEMEWTYGEANWKRLLKLACRYYPMERFKPCFATWCSAVKFAASPPKTPSAPCWKQANMLWGHWGNCCKVEKDVSSMERPGLHLNLCTDCLFWPFHIFMGEGEICGDLVFFGTMNGWDTF